MRKISIFSRMGLGLMALVCLTAAVAYAQVLIPRWNLQVRNADVPDSCVFGVFRPELKIINNSGASQDLATIQVQMYFNNATPVEFVNSTTVNLFSFDDHFLAAGIVVQGPSGTLPNCAATPARKANQFRTLGFTAQAGSSISMPPGAYALLIPTYRRDGGAVPFDFQCDDFSKVVDSNHNFREDSFYSLLSNGARICEFINPRITDSQTGTNPCLPFGNGCF
jgi:hypothetical protein